MKDESDTTVLLDYTKAGDWGDTNVQHCIKCGQIKLPSDYWQRRITYWQDLAVANRKVAEDNQTNAERYRRVREFLQRGDGLLDTRGMDDAGFDRMIDSLKECGK